MKKLLPLLVFGALTTQYCSKSSVSLDSLSNNSNNGSSNVLDTVGTPSSDMHISSFWENSDLHTSTGSSSENISGGQSSTELLSGSSTGSVSSEIDRNLSSGDRTPLSSSSRDGSLYPDSLESKATVIKCKEWLALSTVDRIPFNQLEWAKSPLTANDAQEVADLFVADVLATIEVSYGDAWDSREITVDSHVMPFYYQVFGSAPKDGRSLYISMHGGGGTTAAANDGQYSNQKHLYDSVMKDMEGVYLAPRAPTNTWNLWFQGHIDTLFGIIIQMAMLKEAVNPNKVYLLGYSAGGDGVYQLAPRIADYFAAASMMAGHPNDANPANLRNLPFSIQVGGDDGAYDRNKVALEWGQMLDVLQAEDPEGYEHFYEIREGLPHWMNLEDAVALPWMSGFTRNPIPEKVVWRGTGYQDNTFYWLQIVDGSRQNGKTIVASYNREENSITIHENYNARLNLLLNDAMLDLNTPITVYYQESEIGTVTPQRSVEVLFESASHHGDPGKTFSALITVIDNESIIGFGVAQ